MLFYDYTIYIDKCDLTFDICATVDIPVLFYNNLDLYQVKRLITQQEDPKIILSTYKTFGRLEERKPKYRYDKEKRIAFIPHAGQLEHCHSEFLPYLENTLPIQFSIRNIAGLTIRSTSKHIFMGLNRLFRIDGMNIIMDDRFRCRCRSIKDDDYIAWKEEIYNFTKEMPSTIEIYHGHLIEAHYKENLDLFFYEFEKVMERFPDVNIEDSEGMSPSEYFKIE